jgi:hypothetical protein
MVDLAIYTSLGIPALPATGVARMSESRLKTVSQLWASQFGDGWPPSFVLPGLSLHNLCLHRCPYLEKVASQLAQLQRLLLDLDFCFRWWTPSSTTLSDLSFLIQYGSTERLSSVVSRSLEGHDAVLSVPEWTGKPYDLSSALSCWQSDARLGLKEESKTSWKIVQQHLRRQVVEPFIAEAQASKPTERVRLLATSQVLQGAFSRLFVLAEELDRTQLQGATAHSLEKAVHEVKTIHKLTGTAHARSR